MFAQVMRSPHGAITTLLVLLSEDEGTASLEDAELPGLGLGALELQSDLLGLLSLLAEDGLGLTAEALLLRVVTALTLGDEGRLTGLVLRHLLRRVLVALLAVRVAELRDAHHGRGTGA